MFKKIVIIAVSVGFSLGVSAKDDFAQLTHFIKETKKMSGLNSGTAVAIVKDGKIIYQENFGYSNIQQKIPVTKETSFYVASTTKPFYAMSTLVDINNNQLKADDTIGKLFANNPFKQLSKDVVNQVTVNDLLVHSSGIENEALGWAVAYTGLHDLQTRKELVSEKTFSLNKSKYGEFNYTNFGYNLLSVWYDDNHDISWQQNIQKNIYTPLNMKHTTSIMSDAIKAGWDIAKPYSFIAENRNEALYLEKVDTTMHSAGGMISSASDMAQMVIAQLEKGKINGAQVLPARLIKESQTQQVKTDAKYGEFARDGYAWGWYTGDYKGQRMLHHFGGFAGTHAMVSFIPEKNIGLVILNNEGVVSGRMSGVASGIAYDILLGLSDGKKLVKAGLEKLSLLVDKFPGRLSNRVKKLDSRPWKLSNPREDYVGTYRAPLLGNIYVELDSQGEFQYSWGQLKSKARAFTNQDSMRVELVMFSGSVVQFERKSDEIVGLVYGGSQFVKVN